MEKRGAQRSEEKKKNRKFEECSWREIENKQERVEMFREIGNMAGRELMSTN